MEVTIGGEKIALLLAIFVCGGRKYPWVGGIAITEGLYRRGLMVPEASKSMPYSKTLLSVAIELVMLTNYSYVYPPPQ